MNTRHSFGRLGIIGALMATFALAATAVHGDEVPAAPPGAEGDDAQARLEEAQKRLEAAAREIAALTAQMMGDIGIDALARLEELARQPRPVMLGVNIGPVGEPGVRENGVRVLGVTPGSPAEAAGIRSGDVLLSLNGRPLDWEDDRSPVSTLLEALKEVEPGTQVQLEYRRDGQVATASVEARPWSWARAFHFDRGKAGAPPLPPMPPGAFMHRFMADRWGDMELVTLSPGLGEYFKADEGVLVVRAPSDTTLGLQDGDVIVDIAGRAPQSPTHVARILRSYAPGERLVLTIIRAGERLQLEADVPAAAGSG